MKRFRFRMLLIVGLVGLVVFLSFYMNHGFASWAYPITTIGGLIFLTIKAVRLHGNRRDDPIDLQCASENIQALGVFFLLASFAVSTSSLENINFYGDLSFKALKPLITPFIEGLLATGSATLLSTILRQYQVTKEGVDSDDSDRAATIGAGIAGSIHDILSPDDVQKINEAFVVVRRETEGLQDSVREVRSTLGEVNSDLRLTLTDLLNLLQQVGGLIENMQNFFTDSNQQEDISTLLQQVGVLIQDINKVFIKDSSQQTTPYGR